MAIGNKTDFVIYNDQFWGGMIEVLQQNTDAFNTSSNNALRLVTRSILGDYEKESYLKNTASLVGRRDTSANTSVTSLKLSQGEYVGVKLNRRLGPVDMDRDAFRKIGVDPKIFSAMLGAQSAPAIAKDYIDIAMSAVSTCIKTQASLVYDATADTLKTANHTALVGGMSLLGDKASRLVCFVSHSKPYFDLMKQQIADKLFEVAGATVYAGTIATFGKPWVVIDSPALMVAGSTPTYNILSLVENAAEVAESEERDIISQPITGLENLADRIQGEYAFNLKVKGFTYLTSAGDNPTDVLIGTGSSWALQAFDKKLGPGVCVKVQ